MTSGDEIISDLVSDDNEYSYEENERKSKKKFKRSHPREDRMLGKKKREETDELISEEMNDPETSMKDNTDSGVHVSSSLTKAKRIRKRKPVRRSTNEDRLDE